VAPRDWREATLRLWEWRLRADDPIVSPACPYCARVHIGRSCTRAPQSRSTPPAHQPGAKRRPTARSAASTAAQRMSALRIWSLQPCPWLYVRLRKDQPPRRDKPAALSKPGDLMAADSNAAAASQSPAMSAYEALAHALPAKPADTPRSSLGERDYRPGHGQPGGAAVDREIRDSVADPNRFDYPSAPRQSYRSGQQP
jgi:hypothetical protein